MPCVSDSNSYSNCLPSLVTAAGCRCWSVFPQQGFAAPTPAVPCGPQPAMLALCSPEPLKKAGVILPLSLTRSSSSLCAPWSHDPLEPPHPFPTDLCVLSACFLHTSPWRLGLVRGRSFSWARTESCRIVIRRTPSQLSNNCSLIWDQMCEPDLSINQERFVTGFLSSLSLTLDVPHLNSTWDSQQEPQARIAPHPPYDLEKKIHQKMHPTSPWPPASKPRKLDFFLNTPQFIPLKIKSDSTTSGPFPKM